MAGEPLLDFLGDTVCDFVFGTSCILCLGDALLIHFVFLGYPVPKVFFVGWDMVYLIL